MSGSTGTTGSLEQVLVSVRRYRYVLALEALFAVMLALRLRAFDTYIQSRKVYFAGVDAYYHYRHVSYTVENWPRTMSFDPWTGYPEGSPVGAFGTLYDLVAATIALIVGGGDPSAYTIAVVVAVLPAVLGAAAVFPIYFLTKVLLNGARLPALLAAGMFSLFPGIVFIKGVVGSGDHHSAEVFLSTLALYYLVVTFKAIRGRDISVEQLTSGALFEDQRLVLAVLGAGLTLSAYHLVWPPAIFLSGSLAIALTLHALWAHLNGESPVSELLVGSVIFGLVGAALLAPMRSLEFSLTLFSAAQPVIVGGLAVWFGLLAAGCTLSNRHDLPVTYLPIGAGASTVAGLGCFWLVSPTAFGDVVTGIGLSVGLATPEWLRTISEAAAWIETPGDIWAAPYSEYGLIGFTGLVGVWVTLRSYLNKTRPVEELLIVVWAVIVLLSAINQYRWNYYLAPLVAVLGARALWAMLTRTETAQYLLQWDRRSLPEFRHAVVLVLVCCLLSPTLVYPSAGTVVDRSVDDNRGQYILWEPTLEWLAMNTPEQGTYGGGGEPFDYYGAYEFTGDFDYPPGTYGTVAWWEYGHWLTVESRHIPQTNPLQQNAPETGRYLLGTDIETAEQEITGISDEPFPRYVIVDYQTVDPTQKLENPAVWAQYDVEEYREFLLYQATADQYRGASYVMTDTYYRSIGARLYHHHGSAQSPGSLVLDYEERVIVDGAGRQQVVKVTPSDGQPLKQFETRAEAEAYVKADGSAQIGGIGPHTTVVVPALQQYRLVYASPDLSVQDIEYQQALAQQAQLLNAPLTAYLPQNPSAIKVFERVDGATLIGTATPNTTVTATVQLNIETRGQTFTYTQYAHTDADGNFEMVVPYSTTGYDNWGVEQGYTNVAVQALGPYVVSTETVTTTVQVTEAQVIGEDENATRVNLRVTESQESV